MDQEVTPLTGRDQLLQVTGDHPYAQLSSASNGALHAFARDRAVVWFSASPTGPTASALGDPPAAARLLAHLLGAGRPARLATTAPRRVHLPRTPASVLRAHLRTGEPEDWDFRWTRVAPPPQPGQDRVVVLGPPDEPAISRLLDRAFPGTFTRPGDPRVRRWYGIRDGDRLVACCADRSRGGVASLGALAVHPQWRGRGLGAALTGAITTASLREFPVATLGVMVGNAPATQLYQRLGFTETAERTSVNLLTGV